MTRDELRTVVWEGDVTVDFETGLNTCIRQVRRALGDEAGTPRYLETLPKRGYRFVAPVDVVDGVAPPVATDPPLEPAPPSVPPGVGRGGRRARLAWFAALAVFASLAVAVVFSWRGRAPSRSGPPGVTVIAVLPFTNLSGDPTQEYLADGLTEELIARLSVHEPSRLAVIARTSAMAFKGTTKTIAGIARDLRADLVLEGSVRKEAGELRVTAQLIRASDETHLWAESYDRSAASPLAVQDELARRIARAAAVPFREGGAGPASISREAWDLLLKGRYALHERGSDVAGAVRLFAAAVEAAPEAAATHASLAEALLTRGLRGAEHRADLDRARVEADAALRLDPRESGAWAVLANLRLQVDWDLAGAEDAWRRSLAVDPGRASSHHARATLLAALRRHDEALAEVRAARALDPLSPSVNADVGWHSHLARRYDEAAAEFRATLKLPDPEDWMFEWTLLNDVARRQEAEAIPVLEALLARHGETAAEREARARLSPAEALRRYLERRASGLSKAGTPDTALAAGIDLALLGRNEEALAALARAVDGHALWLPPILAAAPALDALRGDPRFAVLAARVGVGAAAKGEGRGPS